MQVEYSCGHSPVKIVAEAQVYPGRQNPTGIRDVQMRVLAGGGILTEIRMRSPVAVRELPASPSTLSLALNGLA